MDNQKNVKKSNDAMAKRLYAPYAEAAWGFINHWYPVKFSNEIAEGGVVGAQLLGVPLVLRRSKGKVYALRDQCLHRGVKLSAKPMCLTDDSITCWYHGFTYSLETGELISIVAAPDDEIIGTTGIPVYPVEEVNGMIFVFVKSEDFDDEVPPLKNDLPILFPENNERFPHPFWPDAPSVIDKNSVCLGVRRIGNANWRLACENGFDAGHLLIHKDNAIVLAKDWAMPLGIKPVSDQATRMVEDENGPKGFINMYFTEHYEPVLENERLNVRAQGNVTKFFRTSMYVPGVLMVENWPEEHVAQYEWYVPITEDTYEYWEVLVRHCETPEEREAFEYRFKNFYEPMALHGFNDCDLFARDAMQDFYADGTGWEDEQLGDMDYSIITWRKLASRYNRGIAKKPRGVPGVIKGASNELAEIRGPQPGVLRDKGV